MLSHCLVDVTVTSPNFVDMNMFDLWIQGYSVSEACIALKSSPMFEEFRLSNRMLAAHICDHFAQFMLLENGLRHPTSFLETCTYHQLSLSLRKQLIHKYYSLDHSLLRELVCHKLSNKTRRELSDIAERCELRARSCKRQFDNLLCVNRRTEDLPGCLVKNIRTLFLLPSQLAESYAAVIFILANRFEVSKKILAYISFDDLAYCTGQLMSHWSMGAKDLKGNSPLYVELDLQFFQDLKICKPLAEKKELMDQHKSMVLQILSESHAGHRLPMLDTNFKTISKAIITIACGLTHAKEMRDFFLDIVEKIIEPMKTLGWLTEEVHVFLEAYASAATMLPSTKPPFMSIWNRFVIPFSKCIEHLYHS